MKSSTIIMLTIFLIVNTVFAQEDSAKNGTKTEQRLSLELPSIQVIPIKDTQTDRQYELYVKLPEGYSENNAIQHPVIYFTDAMWHVELLSGSTEYMLEDVILVGISWQKDLMDTKPYKSRFRDYSIKKSNSAEKQAKYQFGEARNHLNFIRNDVIQYVESNYRTDPDNRTYFGYSLGGLFGSYIVLTQPNSFKNYILGSPSLRTNIPYLSKLSDSLSKSNSLNVNIFISMVPLKMS
ncbi:hypothetical protein JQC67_12750 [Aurantibacter crassamenti]|uniref:alpha/beta hydrolase n=1 Tax=Aurantibacter crassamenti TaxID=1837375 RepID=UPI001939BF8E|nr:alpha/beta hydrolase-fold protein [Aurantibacter crassamenti]MBM1107013.1 hypothetical protein [Aurantibacter crassamenti]